MSATYTRWVLVSGCGLHVFDHRRRSGLIDDSCARRIAPRGASAWSRDRVVRPERADESLPPKKFLRLKAVQPESQHYREAV
jgi:hypothetical protein